MSGTFLANLTMLTSLETKNQLHSLAGAKCTSDQQKGKMQGNG